VKFALPVISVGNLTVGGTGKTPMVEYLVRLLSPTIRTATLSRGYGRKTKGFRLANNQDSAETIGDEPFQYFRKFGTQIKVSVGEERALAIPLLLQESSDLEVVLLDDAFQHRRVNPSFSILLCDYTRPFYDDLMMPAGRLRESRHNASRADAVVVTKCPAGISDDELMEIERSLRTLVSKPVFFSTVAYGSPVPFERTTDNFNRKIILVTGIANPTPLVQYVSDHFELLSHISFPDHHFFDARDVTKILGETRKHPGSMVLTTEKDMVKLESPELRGLFGATALYYLPITVQFLKDEREFDEMILNHIRSFE
jgi:tetraacyldisaccharide 4'-kinase